MDYDCRSLVHYTTKDNSVFYAPLPTVFVGKRGIDEVEFLPSFSLSYRHKGGNTYLSARKGFKAGGFNTQLFSDILRGRMVDGLLGSSSAAGDASLTAYKPETNWNYELGTNLSLLDGSLDVSAVVFYIACRNQQLTVFPKNGTGRMMSNAGRSRSYGAELAIKYRVGRVTLNGSFGCANAKFEEYESGGKDYAGNYLPFAPRETFSANVAYDIPVPRFFASRFVLNVGWNGVGRIYWNEENSLGQSFYGLWSASLSWEKGHFGASLWGKNLFDREYNTFYFSSINHNFFSDGKPLQFGLSLHLNL
jgi:outer membrane receptor protein involved in Fe transport